MYKKYKQYYDKLEELIKNIKRLLNKQKSELNQIILNIIDSPSGIIVNLTFSN